MDSLASHGVNSRVLVSDHVVSMKKVRRARRYCQANGNSRKRPRVEADSHDDTTSNEDTSDAVIEIQDSSGQWSQYTALVDGDVTASQPQTSSSTQEQEHGVASPLFQSFTPSLISANWFTANGNEGAVQPTDFSLVEYEAEVPQTFVQYEPYANNAELYADNTFPDLELVISSPLLPELVQRLPATSYLNDLPFAQFERDLALKRLQLATSPSPMQESGLFSRVQRLANMFATEAATVMTQENGKTFPENLEHAWLKLQTLHTILPRVPQGEPPQMIKEVELHRLLLYSSANGFVGLDGVPMQTIFRFLNSSTTSLLGRLFRDNPGHVVKSLAENLFRAAIESDDHNATRFFLKTGLVNVDKTYYIVDGEKYTPLERAAELQRLKVVKELLQFKPKVNKTLLSEKEASDGILIEGVLGLLIIGICPADRTKRNHSTFSSEYLEVVDLLIEAGAKIRGSCIYRALGRFVRMNLAKKLLYKLAPSDHSEVFRRYHILSYIVEELAEKEATEAIAKIVLNCEQTGCKQCLSRFSAQLDQAIVIGAGKGYIKLVQSLFQHAKSPTQILCAAIRSSNHELIEFVLAQKLNISQVIPAGIGGTGTGNTTPLAEAISSGDDVLIRRLENRGALENLDKRHGRFALDIAAASRVGNIEYVKKLLLHHPKATGSEMGNALLEAIENRRESIVRLLLDVGAEHHTGEPDFFIEAYKWGEQSVLNDLMSTFPDSNIYYVDEDNNDDLMSEDAGIFEYLCRSGRFTSETLSALAILATRRGDSAMLDYLLESGAEVMNGSALEHAVDGDNSDLLRILLKHIPPTKTPIRSFGTEAVRKAIRQHPSNIDALGLLLACTAIDFKSWQMTQDNNSHSPLGLAVQRDASSGCSDFPLTRRLLDAGCNIDQIADIGKARNGRRVNRTAILIAIRARNSSMVQFLISQGADINKEAIHGIKRTPLQAAAEHGSLDIVELLLQKGANANDKAAERWGATALQCAAMSGNCNIAALLLDNGASLYSPPSTYNGQSLIECAAEHGRVDMIQFLWNASAGFGFPIEECRRAMELAEGNGHMACRDLILDLAVMSGIMPMIEMSL